MTIWKATLNTSLQKKPCFFGERQDLCQLAPWPAKTFPQYLISKACKHIRCLINWLVCSFYVTDKIPGCLWISAYPPADTTEHEQSSGHSWNIFNIYINVQLKVLLKSYWSIIYKSSSLRHYKGVKRIALHVFVEFGNGVFQFSV